MSRIRKQRAILAADDDPDDQMLIRDALEETGLADNLRFVENGEELMDFLHRRGRYADPLTSPVPELILLDLNMPKCSGREVLEELKTNPELRRIPVVVLTTSSAQEDIDLAYDLGACSYIIKPVSYEELVNVMKAVRRYWFETVELAPRERGWPHESSTASNSARRR